MEVGNQSLCILTCELMFHRNRNRLAVGSLYFPFNQWYNERRSCQSRTSTKRQSTTTIVAVIRRDGLE